VKSEYLGKFKESVNTFQLFGNRILVERVDMGEAKTAGGIIIVESQKTRPDLQLQKPHIAIVLAIGKGYFDADENSYEALEVQPGNIVMLNSSGVIYYSTLPGASSYTANTVGITDEGNVQMVFKDKEAFEAYAKIMGGT
jgi:co-chaperonin GroES (HSP10)